MAEKAYIEREAANALLLEECSPKVAAYLIDAVAAIPAADVRPAVTCCDCKYFQVNVSPSGYLPQGVPEWECRHWCRPTDPTDFCSYGEKWEES